MNKIKNWGFYSLFVLGAILDLGFGEIQPLLSKIGVGDIGMDLIRIGMIILGALKLKLSLPTQNVEKLEKIIEDKNEEL
jgi:hypothetical protein